MVEQLQSYYFLKNGRHCIEYKFRTKSGYGFTKIRNLWVEAWGTDTVNISEDHTEASFFVYSDQRATKYSSSDLKLIFSDLVYENKFLLHKTEVPVHFLVKSY